MQFLISRLSALVVWLSWVFLLYGEFKSRRPGALVVTLFVGSILAHIFTKPIFDWGEKTRRMDSVVIWSFIAGIFYTSVAVVGGLILLPGR